MTVSRQAFLAGTVGASALASIGIITPLRAAEFDMKFGVDVPAEHPITLRATEAFARINKASNGRVSIKAFPASVLGSDPQMLSQLRSGATEMLAMPGALVTVVPTAEIENLAYAFNNRETVFRAMDGDLGAVIREDFAARDIVVLEKIWENGFRNITTSTKPIRNIDDLAGLKIRVSPGKIRVDTFQSLGAAPTPIALSELYTSMQTHIVDAQENPLVLIEQQKFFEVQKYVSMSEHIWSGYWTLVNPDVWKRLGPGLQQLISTEMARATLESRADVAKEAAVARDHLIAKGMQFNDVDKDSFRKKLVESKYYERWKATFGAKAWAALEKYANKLG